jgi:hypothetical protein
MDGGHGPGGRGSGDGWLRLLLAVSAVLVLAGAFWWSVSLAPRGESAVGDFLVFVVGPDGEAVANGPVASRATPLDALQVLASERGFLVEVEKQPWIGGGCTSTYVVAIAGHRETATGGWNYYTREAGGNWTWGPVGAACHVLQPGEQVEWCWVESDVCRHHAT